MNSKDFNEVVNNYIAEVIIIETKKFIDANQDEIEQLSERYRRGEFKLINEDYPNGSNPSRYYLASEFVKENKYQIPDFDGFYMQKELQERLEDNLIDDIKHLI